jgi:DNA-binding NtrC family response regulator
MTFQCNRYRSDLSPRIMLLVEDEPFVREATSNILSYAGFAVLTAVDAQQALRIFFERSGMIDLVMTDMILPGATGLQLSHDLHKNSPLLAVLITSGYSEQQLEATAVHTYFLAKPYSMRKLLGKIETILSYESYQPGEGPAAQAG